MTRNKIATGLEIFKHLTLLAIGTVLTLSVSIVREISSDVTAIKILVARSEQVSQDIERRTGRLEAKVYGK
jgi:hypothetical protein